jgi:hypothetical protein
LCSVAAELGEPSVTSEGSVRVEEGPVRETSVVEEAEGSGRREFVTVNVQTLETLLDPGGTSRMG